jgi:hypothetical protein
LGKRGERWCAPPRRHAAAPPRRRAAAPPRRALVSGGKRGERWGAGPRRNAPRRAALRLGHETTAPFTLLDLLEQVSNDARPGSARAGPGPRRAGLAAPLSRAARAQTINITFLQLSSVKLNHIFIGIHFVS